MKPKQHWWGTTSPERQEGKTRSSLAKLGTSSAPRGIPCSWATFCWITMPARKSSLSNRPMSLKNDQIQNSEQWCVTMRQEFTTPRNYHSIITFIYRKCVLIFNWPPQHHAEWCHIVTTLCGLTEMNEGLCFFHLVVSVNTSSVKINWGQEKEIDHPKHWNTTTPGPLPSFFQDFQRMEFDHTKKPEEHVFSFTL